VADRPLDLPLAVCLDGPAGDLEATFRNRLSARVEAVRLMPRAGLGFVLVLAFVNLLAGALPVVFVVATSVLLGRIPAAVGTPADAGGWHALLGVFAVATTAFAALQVVAPMSASLGAALARRIDASVYDELMAVSLSSGSIAPLEDPEVQDELQVAGLKLEFGDMSPGNACTGMLALIARYTQLAGYAAVVTVRFSWWAGLGMAAAVLLIRAGMRGGLSRFAEAVRRLARAERKAYYLRNLAIMSAASKEIRVFGLAGWLRRTYREVYLMWLFPKWAARRRFMLRGFLAFAVWGFILAAVVLGAVGAHATGAMTLTSFALVAQSSLGALRLCGYYPEADMQTAIGISGYNEVRDCAALIRKLSAASAAGPTRPVPGLAGSIQFDGVTFGYPSQSRLVFDKLDLTLPVGRCTAIVGVNGVGKTTLVKLLARLYEPVSGTIRADGVDIRAYPAQEWRSKIAVIFQDFLRYEISAADNIGFGAIESLGDRAGIRAAAEAAGIAAALDALPNGMDTPLARHMAGGGELSGGQWQRIALARALFAARHGAPVVVLDEPTASLDLRAEATFFDRFAELLRGTTTLLISHRFSTVRHADLILVLDRGGVLEQGSHDELMARDGQYARLFRLQADQLTGTDAPDSDPGSEPGGIADRPADRAATAEGVPV
jgi:ATP-binding cassette subfamily B protein